MAKAPTDKEQPSAGISKYALNVLYCWDLPYEALGLPRPKKRNPAEPPAKEDQLLEKLSISAVRGRELFREEAARTKPAVASLEDKPYFSDWKTIYRIHALWNGLSPEGQHYVLQRLEENLKKARKPKPRN
jgi:hypothetical protein